MNTVLKNSARVMYHFKKSSENADEYLLYAMNCAVIMNKFNKSKCDEVSP